MRCVEPTRKYREFSFVAGEIARSEELLVFLSDFGTRRQCFCEIFDEEMLAERSITIF